MRKVSFLVIIIFSFVLAAFAGTTVIPTSTLTKETTNNTSAADNFRLQSNSNLGASNVSKVPMRSLLYMGATTKVYVHFMGWFGGANHMNVGYTSNDAKQVAKQVDDMMSRGVDGAILDWYGENNTRSDQSAQLLRTDAEKRGGNFQFAIMEDVGALKTCAATSGCDLSGQVITDLTYAYNKYETSSAYIRENGRPVVFFFGLESYTLDWTRIRAGVPGNPIFIFRNSGAFPKAYSDGGFSWLGISSTDPNSMGLSYMDNFYSTAVSYPAKATYGSGYKGFDDTLASWGSNRIVNQQCAQTWLATMAGAGKYYSTSRQLPNAQIVTWNDYEEGSELESGVDNCVTVSGAISGDTLSWSIKGQENTLDRYTVFISTDGQNLMPLADVAAGTHTLDLSQFGLDQANYTMFVKAIGKSSIKNQMSAEISYVSASANLPPVAVLAVSPLSGMNSLTAAATIVGSSDPDGEIVSTTIDFGDGTSANTESATHLYNTAGNFTVKATVTDNKGATGTATATVTVTANQAPQARLAVSPGTGVAPVIVSASTSASTDADGSIQSSSINFGDGTVLSGSNATHTYASAGTYTVIGLVTDDLGATSTTTASVTVIANQPPVAMLTATPTTGIAPVTVTASTLASTDVDGRVALSNIAWGDGATSVGPNATHVYATAGTYTITATVSDDRGADSLTTAIVSVIENQPPVAALSVTPTYGIAPVTVTASTSASTDVDGKIASSNINWGDGSTSTGPNATHIYNTGGTYTLTATVSDDRGVTSKAVATVNVNYGVTIMAPTNGATVTGQIRVAAKVSSSAAVTAIRIYLDSASVYLAQNVGVIDTMIAAKAGIHRITVQSWNAKGLVQKSVISVTVPNQPPTARLSITPLISTVGTTIAASTVASTDPDGSITSSTISWGDGATSIGPAASHTYNAVGSYMVTATVTDNLGVKSSTSATVKAVAGVTILQPTNNAIVSSSARVAATASSNVAVAAIRIYVDGTSVFLANNVSSINTLVTMTKGTHRVTVQSWDKNGVINKAAISLNVR